MQGKTKLWWEHDRGEKRLYQAILNAVQILVTNYGEPLRDHCRNIHTLYEGRLSDPTGVGQMLMGMYGQQLSYNVVKSCVDTQHSHILEARVRPMLLTEKGSWELQQQAKGMQKALDGMFDASDIWTSAGEDTCRDGIMWGMGPTLVELDRAGLEQHDIRLMPWELLCDPHDGDKGKPRSLFAYHAMERSVLRARFKGNSTAEKLVDSAPRSTSRYWSMSYSQHQEIADPVEVVRAWHLPSSCVDRDEQSAWDVRNPSHDGREVIVVEGGTLEDSPYPFPYFPVPVFRPRRRAFGFRGLGLPEMLAGIQLEITKMLKRIAAIMDLHAVPLLYVWDAARVSIQKMQSNQHSRILTGRQPAGQALQYITPQSVPAEYIAQLQRLIEWAYRMTGISEMSASSTKPAGIESGRALQTLQDNESIRFTPVYRAWNTYHVELARVKADRQRQLALEAKRQGKSLARIKYRGDRDLEFVDWSEVDIGERRTDIGVWPTALLPKTPTAKFERAKELTEAGFTTREQAMDLMDFPDIQAATNEANAPRRAIQAKIDYAQAGDTLRSIPHPLDDLELLIATAKQRYLTLEADRAPANVLTRIRQLITQAVEVQKRMEAQAAPPPGAEGPMPPGGPMPPPMPEAMGTPGMPPMPPMPPPGPPPPLA